MSLGTLGSTLNDELNRLANGGTYRDMDDMVDEALAAKQWANRENISPYSTDTVGVLNEIAGLGTNRQNWLDFNGVCNYIAGTSGLPAAAALRQIYPTTDLLTGVASYYVDAATPTNWGSLGYVRLNGVSGNFLSTPDTTELDITGDIDIRLRVSADDWTPTARNSLLSKMLGSGSNNSYALDLETSGALRLVWSANGSALITATSTASVSFADGSIGWVRATLDVDNGASGNTVTFFTSTDGTTWTQLGSTVVTAGVTSIFNSTERLIIGARSDGSSNIFTGNLYRTQVLSGIGGTTVLDVNIATDYKSSNLDTFTATTGQTVTVNGVGTIANYGTAGSLLPTTVGSSTAADSNDPKFLDHTGTNYVYLPGVAGNNLSIPSSTALNITGDMDLRAYISSDNWANGATFQEVISKWDTTANTRQYALTVDTLGKLQLIYSIDGIVGVTSATSSVAVPFANGSLNWIRATRAQTAGEIKFFTGTDGTNWTQLGSTITGVSTSNFFTSSTPVMIGNNPTNSRMLIGKVLRAQIFSDITGTTKVLDVDTSVITAGSATSFTAVTGQTVTINRSTSGRKTVAVTQPTWLFGTDDYMEVNNRYMAHSTAAENYVYLSGASGNYMSVADNPPLDITGDLDIQVKVALDDWTPSTTNVLLSKTQSLSTLTYQFALDLSGKLNLLASSNGTSWAVNVLSSVTTGITDGTTKWVRATLDVDNGAGGNTATFYTSDDGITWTQLGTPVTTAGTLTIINTTATLGIGAALAGTNNPAKGKFFRSIIKNGIDGTVVLDADASVITLPSQTTFVDRSSNAYTVTINKSGVGTFVSTGNYLYLPGISLNYASTPDAAPLDITGDLDLRCKVALDDWTPSNGNELISKYQDNSNYSYRLYIGTDGKPGLSWSPTGALGAAIYKAPTVTPTIADGTTKWIRATLDVNNGASGNDVNFYTSDDGITWTQLGTTVTTAGVTSVYSGTSRLEIGTNVGGSFNSRGKFFRAQVLNGIGGTVAFDANFESSITSLLQTSFTESSTNAATVTINRSGSTYRSAGVIDAGYLYPGATNTFSNSTTDFLNFGATDSFTALTVVRQWNTPVSFARYLSKAITGNTAGWQVMPEGTAYTVWAVVRDTGAEVNAGRVSYSQGSLTPISMVVNRATQTLTAYAGNNSGSASSISTKGSFSNPGSLWLGTSQAGSAQDFEFIGAAVFRQALTTAQIRQVVNYFANREAYL